ncbi:aldo-keto reductase, putative [Plasmodium vinckei]|uniref:Aldo-keto reductase, putative n=1 Tax=Plasmodium vinckei TaxID=5860 RepID=A0A6V7T458_PLAVN|nr:aldo-keto reductase, putative [Plasmodium vinckei]
MKTKRKILLILLHSLVFFEVLFCLIKKRNYYNTAYTKGKHPINHFKNSKINYKLSYVNFIKSFKQCLAKNYSNYYFNRNTILYFKKTQTNKFIAVKKRKRISGFSSDHIKRINGKPVKLYLKKNNAKGQNSESEQIEDDEQSDTKKRKKTKTSENAKTKAVKKTKSTTKNKTKTAKTNKNEKKDQSDEGENKTNESKAKGKKKKKNTTVDEIIHEHEEKENPKEVLEKKKLKGAKRKKSSDLIKTKQGEDDITLGKIDEDLESVKGKRSQKKESKKNESKKKRDIEEISDEDFEEFNDDEIMPGIDDLDPEKDAKAYEEKMKENEERDKKIEFIKRVEFLLKEDNEKNKNLYEERPDIDKLRFSEKPTVGSEDLMHTILKNIHNNKEEKQKNSNPIPDFKKKHLFYELLRISNSNSFKTHKIYTHKDLIYGIKYRKLGDSNLCVSELCIGTSMYENDNFISKDDVNVLLNMAFYEYGINFFDICEYDPFPFDPDSYRKSKNKNMNLFLKDKKRENIIINLRMCSSRNVDRNTHGDFYLTWIMDGLKDDKPTFYNIEERLDKILKNLNTNYVDILTIDIPERYVPNSTIGEDTYIWGRERSNDPNSESPTISIEEQFEILEKLVLKGKVRHIAVSNETPWGIYEWCNLARKKKYMKIVCVQNLYNLLHRNEVESSGLVEMMLRENYNVPLVPYGLLAGGILTGKYLDPERYHTVGPETVLGDDQLDHDLDETRGNQPEDYGFLSYGPKNGTCNKYPDLYKSHRCIWAQDATAEYMKLARSHGMTLSQLSLSFVYSRPFVASSIIGPRTIGQLKDSILSLNYPLYQHTQHDLHEIFLRYRGCTMDGNVILNSLEDPNKTSQNIFYKSANIPILSGGTYWDNYPLPFLPKRYEYTDLKEEHDRIKSTFGLNDDPGDFNFINSRIWIEREEKKGEYFALKESNIFKWNKLKIFKGILTKLNEKEKLIYDTNDFHFYYKNNTVYIVPTDEEMEKFYQNKNKIKKILTQTINDTQELYQYQEQLGKDFPDIFNNLDIDLIYKQLINRHNINPLDKKQLEEIYSYIKLTPEEKKTEDFWYIYQYNPFDNSFGFRTGSEP